MQPSGLMLDSTGLFNQNLADLRRDLEFYTRLEASVILKQVSRAGMETFLKTVMVELPTTDGSMVEGLPGLAGLIS